MHAKCLTLCDPMDCANVFCIGKFFTTSAIWEQKRMLVNLFWLMPYFQLGYVVPILFAEFIHLTSSKHRGREGNGTPLQYSCLENPMDGGAW